MRRALGVFLSVAVGVSLAVCLSLYISLHVPLSVCLSFGVLFSVLFSVCASQFIYFCAWRRRENSASKYQTATPKQLSRNDSGSNATWKQLSRSDSGSNVPLQKLRPNKFFSDRREVLPDHLASPEMYAGKGIDKAFEILEGADSEMHNAAQGSGSLSKSMSSKGSKHQKRSRSSPSLPSARIHKTKKGAPRKQTALTLRCETTQSIGCGEDFSDLWHNQYCVERDLKLKSLYDRRKLQSDDGFNQSQFIYGDVAPSHHSRRKSQSMTAQRRGSPDRHRQMDPVEQGLRHQHRIQGALRDLARDTAISGNRRSPMVGPSRHPT